MSPARAILRVAGYEMTNADMPDQVTQICEI
jgi:transcription termination factor NusB